MNERRPSPDRRDAGPPDRGSPQRRRLGRWTPLLAAAAVLGAVALVASIRFAARPPGAVELELGGRVIVLPLVNATGDRSHDWVATGLAEMLSETLARTPGVGVVDPQRLRKVLAARDLDADEEADRERSRELARALGAELVLDATLRRLGGTAVRGDEPYRLHYRLFAAGGEAAGGELRGVDPLAAAGRLADVVARGLAPDAGAAPMASVFSRSPFFDRLYGMGLHQLRTSGAAAAAPHFEIALASRPRFLQAKARLAECRRELGDGAGSRELALAVLDEAQARGERRWQIWSFRALGQLAALEGRFDEAQEHYSRAFSLALDHQTSADRAGLLFELARLALGRGDRPRAEELFVEILELRQGLDDHLGEVDVLLELGTLFLAGGDLEGAGQVLARARQLAAGLDDPWTEMRAVASLGEVARRQKDHASAAELWRQALTFYEQRGDRPRQLLLSRNLADALLYAHDFEGAEDLFHRVVDLATELENPAFEASASLRLAWVLLRTGYPRQARTHLDRALALDRWLDDERFELQQVIAWFAYEEGNYRLAVDTQREVKRQAAERWSPWQEGFLQAFEKALASGRRWPLPGEEAYRQRSAG